MNKMDKNMSKNIFPDFMLFIVLAETNVMILLVTSSPISQQSINQSINQFVVFAISNTNFIFLQELYVEDHDIHHSDFNYNFAKRFGVWDRLFGTYRKPEALKTRVK